MPLSKRIRSINKIHSITIHRIYLLVKMMPKRSFKKNSTKDEMEKWRMGQWMRRTHIALTARPQTAKNWMYTWKRTKYFCNLHTHVDKTWLEWIRTQMLIKFVMKIFSTLFFETALPPGQIKWWESHSDISLALSYHYNVVSALFPFLCFMCTILCLIQATVTV